jgi:diguanylate cyclase (GGDEF)-like protein
VSARRQTSILAERNAALERELCAARQREAAALRLAYHDPLTGLANRTLLEDRLRQALVTARRRKHSVALLLLDLDGFKRVNDELGHAAGDELLRIAAGRLSAVTRGADTACRYGGDEFVVMLPHIDHPAETEHVAAKIRARLADPYLIDGNEVRITASLGTAVYPADGSTCEELMRQADSAMYREKPNCAGTPSR